MFTNSSEVMNAFGDPTSATHKFSMLSSLENFRRADGNFEFKLVYPDLPSPNFNHWLQTSNPMTTSSVVSESE